MKITNDGTPVNATISVEEGAGDNVVVYFHARGGGGLNTEYTAGLALVLDRLVNFACGDAWVTLASRPALKAEPEQRVLLRFNPNHPFDVDETRKLIGRKAARWGKPEGFDAYLDWHHGDDRYEARDTFRWQVATTELITFPVWSQA